MKKIEKGFSVVELMIAVVVIGSLGFVGWLVFNRSNTKTASNNNSSNTNTQKSTTDGSAAELIWQQTEGGWQATKTPPACPDQPIMKSPVKLDKATSILYPGQTRGGNYKPHGGFRFDNSANDDIKVTAPIDGFIIRGSRYTESGEVQYMFDVMNNCGVMYRMDHLRTLSDDMQKIAETFPEPSGGDSRTQQVSPAIYVKQGAQLATSIGFIKSKNVGFDWGVYDYRNQNEASKSASYQSAHANNKELAYYAVCWFDWLSSSDEATIRQLPGGDSTSGKNSDYCK